MISGNEAADENRSEGVRRLFIEVEGSISSLRAAIAEMPDPAARIILASELACLASRASQFSRALETQESTDRASLAVRLSR